MTVPAPWTPFCRLYIDTPRTREAVRELLGGLVRAVAGGPPVSVSVAGNDGYEPGGTDLAPYDPVRASAWTAELDTEATDPEGHEAFRAWVIAAIREARAQGLIVTASCDFEDRVAAETGWNWSASTPEPPGRSVRGPPDRAR